MNKTASVGLPVLEGRRLGEFQLREMIGEGTFGAIYRAEQVGLERQAVVKILRPRLASDETTRQRFLREARLASALDHPYAAHIYAFGEEPDGVLWIAMELVRGMPLDEILCSGPMELGTFVPFFERLCEVVETAHERGIVHRDIKPQNVMVISRAGALLPKLLDLGIAKDATVAVRSLEPGAAPPVQSLAGLVAGAVARSGADAVSTVKLRKVGPADATESIEVPERISDATMATIEERLSRSASAASPALPFAALTGEGDMMGSPGYMSPEQWINSERATYRSDLYSLGVLAYEAISGRRPFSGSDAELVREHLTSAVPPLPEGIPSELHAVLAQAMAKEPADRPASALELARAFRRASGIGPEAPDLPKLARDVAETALREYPQPLAEAVEELDGARGAYQALDAASRLLRAAVRLLAIVALAAWESGGGGRPLSAPAAALLSALRKRRLSDDEWFDLARAFTSPFDSRLADHPVPELVTLLASDSPAVATMATLVRRHAERGAAVLSEHAAADELRAVLPATADVLRALAFLTTYSLAVVGEGGIAELWTGMRRKHRLSIPLPAGLHATHGDPLLVASPAQLRSGLPRDGVALLLAPMALVRKPSLNAEPELLLLEGRCRRGIVLVALPGNLEHTSDAALAWLNRASSVSDDVESLHVELDAPYRGLAPLTAADAEVFFGREREVEGFLNRLRTEPFLVVVGPSGAGKSSFVRAGIIPALGDAFRAVVLRPGASPLTTLRAKVAQLGVRTDDLSTENDAGTFAARLCEATRAADETLLLFVDQFEEVFALTGDARERAVFCAWLAGIATSASEPVRVVLTLRDDFLARAQQERALEQRLAPALELLATPGGPALRRILIEPARRAGFAFESAALVDEMVRAVEGRPGALALLSFAASKLWEQRDVEARLLPSAAYHAMGGVTGALAQHGEAVLERMTPRQRALVREAFRRLVTAEGTRATTGHADLLGALGGDESARSVIERLVTARLLVVAEGEDGTQHIEVIHESLLSAWPRIVEWQREDAAGSRFRDQIRVAAGHWEARHRPRGLLWRDDLVEDYRRWRLSHAIGLTASEEAFGRASLAERDRGRRLRTAVVAGLAMAAVFTSYVAWQQSLSRAAAQRATAEARRATEETKQANHDAEQSALHARDAARLAAARLHVEDPTLQLALLRDIEASDPSPDWAPEARRALHGGAALVVYQEHTGPVRSLAFSSDGTEIASASNDATVRIWRADGSGDVRVLRDHSGFIGSVTFSADGRRIASGADDQTVRVENADGSGAPVVFRMDAAVNCVAFSPDGLRVAAALSDATVHVANLDGAGAQLVLRGPTDLVGGVAYSPDGQYIAAASRDGTVRVWNADGSGASRVLHDHTESARGISFSPDSRVVASAGLDGTVRISRADGSGKPIVLPGRRKNLTGLAFSHDGRLIATSGMDDGITLWNSDGTGELRTFRGFADYTMGVAFSPKGDRVASGDFSGAVRVWRTDLSDEPLVLRGHTRGVESVAVSPDGRRIASASDDGTVRLWNADGSGAPLVLRGHTSVAASVSFSPDGSRIASASFDKTIRVWNADGTGRPVILAAPARLMRASFSPDGHRLAAVGDSVLRVWNADGSGTPLALRGHTNLTYAVSFSPDGRHIATGSLDRTVRVWASDGSGEPIVLHGHTQGVLAVAYSPDGQRIASASDDGTVRVWNAGGSGEPRVLRGRSAMAAVAFSADGRRIASGSVDGAVEIWDADRDGDPVVLLGHTSAVDAVTFSPDGRLVSSSDDTTIRVWTDLAPLRPADPRLWSATNYCLSLDLYRRLLGVDDDTAAALRGRCLERVTAAR